MRNKLSLIFAVILLVGCSQGESSVELIPVSGTVTYQGKPVRDGVIRLAPDKGVQAPVKTTNIINGEYSFTDRSAVAAGTYQVEITAFRGEEKAPLDVKPGESSGREQFLPAEYNKKTTIEKLMVKSGGDEIKKDYSLK
tara:strand:- start:4033 stop:4449 length:417 start_codon:yes stop_codon:yes gene_type:complete